MKKHILNTRVTKLFFYAFLCLILDVEPVDRFSRNFA